VSVLSLNFCLPEEIPEAPTGNFEQPFRISDLEFRIS
jgi:hypothetical protein